MRINWRVRLKNKNFWLAFVPAIFVLIQAILALIGIDINLTDTQDKILDIVNAVFVLLAIVGVVNDPTTCTLSDSELAMTYDVPKAHKKEAEG